MALDYQKFLEARKKNFRDNTSAMASGLEALMTMGSGAVTEPLSGFAGLAGLPFGGVNQGVKNINAVADMGYQPRDPRALQMIGNAVAKPMEWLEGKKQQMGNATLKATDSPTLASLAYTSPEILGSIGALATLGRPAARAGRVAPTQESPDVVDSSRRDFMRNAGLLAAGAAVSRLPNMPLNLLDAPAVETAARAAPIAGSVARTVTRLSPDKWNAALWMRHNPEVAKMAEKYGWDFVNEGISGGFPKVGGRSVGDESLWSNTPRLPEGIDDLDPKEIHELSKRMDNEDVELDVDEDMFFDDENPLLNGYYDPDNHEVKFDYLFEDVLAPDSDRGAKIQLYGSLFSGMENAIVNPNNLNKSLVRYVEDMDKNYFAAYGEPVPSEVRNKLLKMSEDKQLLDKVIQIGIHKPVEWGRDFQYDLNTLYKPTGE